MKGWSDVGYSYLGVRGVVYYMSEHGEFGKRKDMDFGTSLFMVHGVVFLACLWGVCSRFVLFRVQDGIELSNPSVNRFVAVDLIHRENKKPPKEQRTRIPVQREPRSPKPKARGFVPT